MFLGPFPVKMPLVCCIRVSSKKFDSRTIARETRWHDTLVQKEVMMKRAAGVLFVLCILMLAFGTARAQDNYGAIAYSESSGKWGYSYDYGSRGQAENAALRRCKSGDCEIKLWFKNSCGALAKGDKGALGWLWAAEGRREAESRALSESRARGSNCRILCWTCTAR